MSKYQPLSDHLAARSDEEWRPSFSELEAVLGFPLPKAARTSRTWWANDLDRSHSRAWTAHGWAVGDVDHAAERVLFRRGGASGAALVDAAGLQPLAPGAEAQAPPAPPIAREPEELAALAAERPEELEVEDTPPTPVPPVRALGGTALLTAGLAVVAGLGAVLMRGVLRRR